MKNLEPRGLLMVDDSGDLVHKASSKTPITGLTTMFKTIMFTQQ